MKEVRVFGEEGQGAPPQPMVAERTADGSPEDPDQLAATLFTSVQATVRPSSGPEAGEIAQRFEDVLESIGQGSSGSPTPDHAADGAEQNGEEPREAEGARR